MIGYLELLIWVNQNKKKSECIEQFSVDNGVSWKDNFCGNLGEEYFLLIQNCMIQSFEDGDGDNYKVCK